MDSSRSCPALSKEPAQGTRERARRSSTQQGKLEAGDGPEVKEMREKRTSSSSDIPMTVSLWMRTRYLFPRGLVVKFTSTVFSVFLQAVMLGSHRLPNSGERTTWRKLQTLPSCKSPKEHVTNSSSQAQASEGSRRCHSAPFPPSGSQNLQVAAA